MTRRTLYVLRHAKSDWGDASLEDSERVLSARGERDAHRMAAHIEREQIRPDVVLCSPAARTRQTLAAIAPAIGECDVRFEDALYSAERAELIDIVRRIPHHAMAVMLIGHNPGLEDLVGATMSAGTLATIEVTAEHWLDLAPANWRVISVVSPKDLPD